MKILKTYKEIVNESNSLTESSNDLLTPFQQKWCHEYIKTNHTISTSGKVKASGPLRIFNGGDITHFPVRFEPTPCDFMVNCLSILTLEGGPDQVNGDYRIYFCENLTSLKGIATEIGGKVYILDCPNLKSLDGLPKDFPEDRIVFLVYKPDNYDTLISNLRNGITLDDLNTFEKDWEI